MPARVGGWKFLGLRQPAAAFTPQPAAGVTMTAPCQQAGSGKRQQAAAVQGLKKLPQLGFDHLSGLGDGGFPVGLAG